VFSADEGVTGDQMKKHPEDKRSFWSFLFGGRSNLHVNTPGSNNSHDESVDQGQKSHLSNTQTGLTINVRGLLTKAGSGLLRDSVKL